MRSLLTTSSSLLLSALFVAACSSSGGSSAGGSSSGTPDPGPTPPSCAPQTGAPVTHSGDVAGDEVWAASGSPHVVTANVAIRAGAKLTIAPCAEVRLAKGAHLQVAFPTTPNTGTLVAEGTAAQPIHFAGLDGARWASVDVHAPGTARFAHVTFEGGGGGDFSHGATLAAYGDGEDGADPIVAVDHVTILRSLGTGAWLQRGAAFGAGSNELAVHESGGEESPYPIEIEEHALDTLPTGAYTGNRKDEILLDPAGGRQAGSGLLADATLHERGVPYRVGTSKGDRLVIGGRPDGKRVTLTIEPGVVLRFVEAGGLAVQTFTTDKPSTAAIHAVGTAERPIVLGSAADAPKPGDWQGVWFGGIPDASDVLDHVRIEYAGGDCGCILESCSAITQHEGAVIFTAQPAGPFITHTTFAHIEGHGVTEGYDGAFVDLRPTNTFEDVAGCAQTRPRRLDATCPNPKPACD